MAEAGAQHSGDGEGEMGALDAVAHRDWSGGLGVVGEVLGPTNSTRTNSSRGWGGARRWHLQSLPARIHRTGETQPWAGSLLDKIPRLGEHGVRRGGGTHGDSGGDSVSGPS